jgi:hypothetical protein
MSPRIKAVETPAPETAPETKPPVEEVQTDSPTDAEPNKASSAESMSEEEREQLDEEEQEFRALRRDLPNVKGASGAGIVAISVGKAPATNEFFRTHVSFRPIVPIVNVEVGMEKHYFAVTEEMVKILETIGITVSEHVLYLTVTSTGGHRVIPVRQANSDGVQNEYDRTKEIGLTKGMEEWVRLYTDQLNKCYKVFPEPKEHPDAPSRFGEPRFPDLKEAKIFRLAFRSKGRLIDSVEHQLFRKWAARK